MQKEFAEVYTGKEFTPDNVKKIIFDLTTDSWFTSIDTAQKLLKKIAVDIFRKNKNEVPYS